MNNINQSFTKDQYFIQLNKCLAIFSAKLIIIFALILHKINMMTNNRCDLPKVRLKFKTTASDITNQFIQIPRLSKCGAPSSIFPERHKMSKEMHDAFMRYRILKKHNYIKQIANHKKSIPLTECKKMETINTKNKNATFHSKLEIALECSFAKGFHDHNTENLRRSKLNSLKSKNKQSKEALWNNNELSVFKPHTISLKSKRTNDYSLGVQDLANSQQDSLKLEGLRCQYETQNERRQRMLKLLRKTKKQLKATRGSSSFLIQAWKQDKIYRGASYYLKNHNDSYQF